MIAHLRQSGEGKIDMKRFLLYSMILMLLICGGVDFLPMPGHAISTTHYVSKNGNNADGLSWASAWNELGSINWNSVAAGDTILVDGGASSMTYTTMLNVQKSGTSTSPITIQMATDAGRNGHIILFGGRNSQLPYCHQSKNSYTYQTAGVLQDAINFNNTSYVTVDGTKWDGISIHGFNYDGVIMGTSASHNALKNAEVYDDGTAATNGSGWYTDRPGVHPAGSNLTLYQDDIHDNGQDGLQTGSTFSNVTIQHSWLHNARQNPSNTSIAEAFNYPCTHQDGFQVYGIVASGVTITDSVLGPGLMQGVILGDESGGVATSTVNNVSLLNSLFINAYQGTNMMDGSYFPQSIYTNPTNWTIDHVTGYEVSSDEVVLSGTNHTLMNTIYYGGGIHLSAASFTSNASNCQYNTSGDTSLMQGLTANPLFVTDVSGYTNATSFSTLQGTDFTLQAGSPCAGLGSTITSVQQLINTSTNAPPAPTPTTSPIFSAQAASGTITAPFTTGTDASGTYVSQTVDTSASGPSAGGEADYPFSVPVTGTYVVSMHINAPDLSSNSLYVNMDSQPIDDTMCFDVVTTGSGIYQDQGVNWRGNGTPTADQYVPMVFSLAAGPHTLIVRGREANTRFHAVSITSS